MGVIGLRQGTVRCRMDGQGHETADHHSSLQARCRRGLKWKLRWI